MGLFGSKELTFADIKKIYLKGNLRKALKECKKYLSKNKDDYDALNLLGDIQFRLGQKNEALSTFKRLIEELEKGKYLDKLIAQIRKVLKIFPDEYDLYRKLAEAFEKKGLKGEQLKTLLQLSEIYEKNGFIDKSIDILKEITEIDRTNLSNYVIVLERLDKFNKSFEICKFLYSALKIVYEKVKEEKSDLAKKYLIDFSEYALKHKCDLSDLIQFMVPFFREKSEHKDIFIEVAKNVNKEFNPDVYSLLKEYYPLELDLDFYEKLKDKTKEPLVYSDLANAYLSKNDFKKLKELIEEINNLPEYDFKIDFVEIVENLYPKIDDLEILDSLVVLAGKCKAKNLQIEIYKKMSELYYNKGENEKAERIIDFINELEHGIAVTESSTESGHYDENVDLSSLETNEVNEIDLESGLAEEGFEMVDTGDEIDLDLDLDLDSTSYGEEEADEAFEDGKQDDFEIELDLDNVDETESGEVLLEDENKQNKVVEEEDIFADSIDLENYEEEDELKDSYSDLSNDVEAIEEEIFDLDHFSEEVEQSQKDDKLINFTDEEKKVVESMRKSINESVSENDYETHYDLGLAYFELELFDDAIEELKKASYGSKRYESLYMLAECYKKLGRFDDAASIHKLIIADYDDVEKIKNSLYELATIYEESGDESVAKNYYMKLYTLDSNFRDVKEKISKFDFEKLDDKNVTISDDDSSKEIDKSVSKDNESNKPKKKKISFL